MAVGIGAFFFGMHVGRTQTEARYRELVLELTEDKKTEKSAYHQQHIASFYHTVWKPMHDAYGVWFDALDAAVAKKSAVDTARVRDALRGAAAKIINASFPENSPLLTEAKDDSVRSLEAFVLALQSINTEPARQLRNDTRLVEARTYALRAQRAAYEAMRLWAGNKKNGETKDVSFVRWRTMSFLSKSAFVAHHMVQLDWFAPFWAHDVVARIDALDQAGTLPGAQPTVVSTMRKLQETDAVRNGDYAQQRAMYAAETLPLLPIFFEP